MEVVLNSVHRISVHISTNIFDSTPGDFGGRIGLPVSGDGDLILPPNFCISLSTESFLFNFLPERGLIPGTGFGG